MEKVSIFWNTLCLNFKYNFFTGVPFNEFRLLFNTMKSEFLHYIPTTNEVSALGVSTGYSMGGYKSVLVIKSDRFTLIKDQFEKINVIHELPILIVTDSLFNPLELKQFKLSNGLESIKEADDYISSSRKSAILIIEEEDLIK